MSVACSGATPLVLTPFANFINASGAGAHYFNSLTVSNIPSTCDGVDFSISAYGDSSSTPLALFNTSSTNAVVYDQNGTNFFGGTGSIGMDISGSSRTFTIIFTAPVALATSIKKLTLQSSDHVSWSPIGATGPGGGKIFYYSQAGFTETGTACAASCHYLEAAPTSGPNAWTAATTYAWSSVSVGIINPNRAIGTGYANTLAMVLESAASGYAGTITRDYRGPNNLSDWFLPSMDELVQLYLSRNSVGGMVTGITWSSTATMSNNASYILFSDGSESTNGAKFGGRVLRPVRAF